jgi:hypothetical protein
MQGSRHVRESGTNQIDFAMGHPFNVLAGMAALAVASVLDLPVIFVAQPHGGMDPGQMGSQVTSYFEGHTIPMAGIHPISRTSQAIFRLQAPRGRGVTLYILLRMRRLPNVGSS